MRSSSSSLAKCQKHRLELQEESACLVHFCELLQNKTKECEDLKQQLEEKATSAVVTPLLEYT